MRLQSPEGIDAASFLYQSLQAYDFLRLYQLKQCRLQVYLWHFYFLTVLKVGGSDQWGNITAGVDLCQKVGSPDSKRRSILSSEDWCCSWSVRINCTTTSLSFRWKIREIRRQCLVPRPCPHASFRSLSGTSRSLLLISFVWLTIAVLSTNFGWPCRAVSQDFYSFTPRKDNRNCAGAC